MLRSRIARSMDFLVRACPISSEMVDAVPEFQTGCRLQRLPHFS